MSALGLGFGRSTMLLRMAMWNFGFFRIGPVRQTKAFLGVTVHTLFTVSLEWEGFHSESEGFIVSGGGVWGGPFTFG